MRKGLFSKFVLYLKLIRILSWPKNVFVFTPVIFSKHLFEIAYFAKALESFFAFSIAASIVYVINDLFDAKKDVLHPLKKNRPIASGTVSTYEAVVLVGVLIIVLIAFSFNFNIQFVSIVWGYILLNILYSSFLKQIVIVDIFCISIGFLLRVVGGALVVSIYLSSWMILTTLFLSLFLAVMKRRVEIATSSQPTEQRSVLKEYSLPFIDQISAITAGGVIISYALYAVSERTLKEFNNEYFVFTTIFVVFGIFRYMYLVYKKDKGENVVEALVSDIPMLINAFIYVLVILLMVYKN